MQEPDRQLPPAEIERQLLVALCFTQLDSETRATVLERLAAHAFANPDHEIIFQAIAKMPRAPGKHIRETLSARLARMGFPDIDVEPIFEFSPPSPEQIKSLLQQLDS
jgi:hypothetical protein